MQVAIFYPTVKLLLPVLLRSFWMQQAEQRTRCVTSYQLLLAVPIFDVSLSLSPSLPLSLSPSLPLSLSPSLLPLSLPLSLSPSLPLSLSPSLPLSLRISPLRWTRSRPSLVWTCSSRRERAERRRSEEVPSYHVSVWGVYCLRLSPLAQSI